MDLKHFRQVVIGINLSLGAKTELEAIVSVMKQSGITVWFYNIAV